MGDEPLLRLEGVTVRYPGTAASVLDGLDLDVAAGEWVGVTGPAGAGLSTLALVAGGFIPRVVRARLDGRVTIDGVDASTVSADALLGRVGIVFSTPANQLSGSKPTVREELAFGLENLGVPRVQMDTRIGEVMVRLGVGSLADRDPSSLSGGEQQRVAIASIVVMGPRLLVLDEPVAQLDPDGAVAVAGLLGDLAADGTGVLVTDRGAVLLATLERALTLASPIPAPPIVRWEAGRDRPGATIEFEHVTHRYPGGVEAIRDVSLRIEPGATVAIVGPNGAGKTTLVKHLTGLLRPDSGDIRIDGRSIAGTSIAGLAATVGIAFQDPDDQLFERSVEREVRFGPRNLRLDEAVSGQLVATALAATGLTDRRSMNPYDFGLPGRKLVALASVLAMDPAVLVLDEPTLGQDAAGVERIEGLVRDLGAAGRTVIAITHDPAFAARAFDRVLVMGDGSIVDDGAPAQVLATGR
jgi:energy-coupling factor transporter ATP-binding protein EcfA2